MRRQRAPHSDIAALAAVQHGVIARRQLLELSVPATAIDHRVRAGQLLLLHRGVYAMGHAQLRPEGRWCAAVLACGADAVLSHRHAAALWDLGPAPPGSIHVTVPDRGGRRRRRGIVLHRPGGLLIDERTEERGVPVTTVARTLLDIAPTLRPRELELAIRRASRTHRYDGAEIHRLLERHPTHRGAARLHSLVTALRGRGTEDVRSRLEALALQVSDDHDLARPKVNTRVRGHRVDLWWPVHLVVVEADGFEWHATPTQFAEDRARDRDLALAGITVLRFTWWDVLERPDEVARTIATVLHQRGAR